MTQRLLNSTKDFLFGYFSKAEILRLFDDNDVHIIPSEVDFVLNHDTIFRVCYASLPQEPDLREYKLLEIISEAMQKGYKKYQDTLSFSPAKQELLKALGNELQLNGYYFEKGKLVKQAVISSIESLSDEIRRLKDELKSNIGKLAPQDIIGKSKELLEATFKTICEKKGIVFSKEDTFPSLMGKAINSLKLLSEEVTEFERNSEYLTSIIKSSLKINEIRNHHGSGHGKNGDYKPVDKQTAIFISNIAISISDYLESRISKT